MKSDLHRTNVWQAIQKLDRLVFTTREMSALTGMSLSSTSQVLKRLEGRGIVKKMMRGVWAIVSDRRFSPFMLIPFLSPTHQNYLSFLSALHIHGIISQIPQIMTVASTAHTRKLTTPVGVFAIHQIEADFFVGFDWHESGNFLTASPEKALVDCLYLASRRGRRYSSFPELEFPRDFSRKAAKGWTSHIRDIRLRKSVLNKLKDVFSESNSSV